MPKLILDNKPINLTKIFLIIVILILLAGNIFFWQKSNLLQEELIKTKESINIQKTNEKVLNFTKLFIDKVLKAEGEVDFETRLRLETAVREIGDEEILNQWKKFTESQTEFEAQAEVKNLLETLVNKIHPVK
jgi:hypothetical protein